MHKRVYSVEFLHRLLKIPGEDCCSLEKSEYIFGISYDLLISLLSASSESSAGSEIWIKLSERSTSLVFEINE